MEGQETQALLANLDRKEIREVVVFLVHKEPVVSKVPPENQEQLASQVLLVRLALLASMVVMDSRVPPVTQARQENLENPEHLEPTAKMGNQVSMARKDHQAPRDPRDSKDQRERLEKEDNKALKV